MIIYDILLFGIELFLAVFLYIVAGLAVKMISGKWRICYCVPAVVCMFLAGIAGIEVSMSGVYLASVLMLLGFIKDSAVLRKRISVISGILILAALPVCLLNEGYRTIDYVKDFEKGFADMKSHYILAEHKDINWDELYEEYLPKFEEADRNHDDVANCIAWTSFCAKFRDGHVYFAPENEGTMQEAFERTCGNDYGLSLMTMSDGRTVAVNVEENSVLNSKGIHNGTVITAWDGMDIKEASAKSEAYKMMPFADKDNAEFWKALYAAGVGGEQVNITYLDEWGNEQELTLVKIGTYYERLKETMEIVNQGVETGHLTWVDVSEDTACLRIKLMMYDAKSDNTGNHSQMQTEIREKVKELKAAGKKNLILDLRSNGGGSGQMVMALAQLFAPKGEHYYCTDGLWDDEAGCYLKDDKTGKYVKGKDHYYFGENIWDGKIVILVNSDSISAADHLVMLMKGMENVTIMGFTESNGSGQGIGVVHLKSGTFSFSNALLFDQNGDIFVDGDVSWESSNDIDVRVPFDEQAVKVLFDEGGDYLLQKALQIE